MEKGVSDWSEYEACLGRVNQWLSVVDEAVDEAMELRDTLDDKVKHLDHAKVEHDDDTNVCKELRITMNISSVESQKGVIAVQRCSVENPKGAVAIEFVQQ